MNEGKLEANLQFQNEMITENNTAHADLKISHRRTLSRAYSGHFLQRDPATPPSTPTMENKKITKKIEKYALTFNSLKELPDFPGKVDAHFNLLIALERKLKHIDNYVVINKENISTLHITKHTHAIAELKYKSILLAKQLIDEYIDPAYDFAQNKRFITPENHKENLSKVAQLIIGLTSMNTVSLNSLQKEPIYKSLIFKSFLHDQKSKSLLIHSLLYKELPKELSHYIDKKAYTDLILRIIDLNKEVKKASEQNTIFAKHLELELSSPNYTFSDYIAQEELLGRFISYLKEKYDLNLLCFNNLSAILVNIQEALWDAVYQFHVNHPEHESKLTKLYGYTTKDNATLYFKNNDALLNALFVNLEKVFQLTSGLSEEEVQHLFFVFFDQISVEEKRKQFLTAIELWFQEIENFVNIKQLTNNTQSQAIYTQDPINTIALTLK